MHEMYVLWECPECHLLYIKMMLYIKNHPITDGDQPTCKPPICDNEKTQMETRPISKAIKIWTQITSIKYQYTDMDFYIDKEAKLPEGLKPFHLPRQALLNLLVLFAYMA